MDILNLSSLSLNQVLELMPKSFHYNKLIVFPDICKVTWLLPTGIAVLTSDDNWRKYAISDIGCGMLLCKSTFKINDFKKERWNDLYNELKIASGIGDFTKGNHFINAMTSKKSGKIFFLVHSGIDKDIPRLNSIINEPSLFDDEYLTLIKKAKLARQKIFKILINYFGPLEYILDRDHNHFEITNNGVIIRRGAVKIKNLEYSIVPSHILGDTALVKASPKVNETLFSLCHGTGRLIQREESLKNMTNIEYIFRDIYIPPFIDINKLYYDTPSNYRDLQNCLPMLDELIYIEDMFKNIAYIGKI